MSIVQFHCAIFCVCLIQKPFYSVDVFKLVFANQAENSFFYPILDEILKCIDPFAVALVAN